MLIPLLPVEGTGVITPACGRIMRTGGTETLAHKSGEPCPQTRLSHKVVSIQRPPSAWGESRACVSTALWFNEAAMRSNISVQTGRAVLRHTQTHQKGIWLLTATGQLWSVANINDISASANANPLPHPWGKKEMAETW